jgi:Ca-activated chloride channel homolog
MRRPAIYNLIPAGAAVCLAALAADFVIRSDVPLVLLDVSVQDRAGGFVSGLQKENFRVLENGHPQPVTVFAGRDVPVTAGILVDESFSMGPKRADALTAAMTFVHESNPQDEMFVINFNHEVRFGLPKEMPFSGKPEALRLALFQGVPVGKTALYDAVMAGLKHLTLGRRDKKALILISDGGDNASHATRQEMLAFAESSLATIYTIGLFDEDDPDRNPGILNRLAHISGGEAFFPQNPAGTIPVCRRIAKDIRARYTLGYTPAGDMKAGWRHLRVQVSAAGRGKLVAHTRAGYRYAGPQESQAVQR